MPTALTAEKKFQILDASTRRPGVSVVAATAAAMTLSEDQALKGVIWLTGAAGSTGQLTWPYMTAAQKGMRWLVYNASTTGVTIRAYNSLTDDTSFSTGVTATAARSQEFMWSGTDFVETTSEFTIP